MSTRLDPPGAGRAEPSGDGGGRDPRVWISSVPDGEVARRRAIASGPLAGMTAGVKDNIDVAGLPTTAGCPEFAYEPDRSARSVELLEAAGAIVVGKTNMDQFATGLVGTRSPYGALSCVADDRVVSGGSSSGSAVAVARWECDIALGTDTAGSGRVPAALNGVVGLKPTRGLVPAHGVVPACRTLDCVTVFARDVRTARLALAAVVDPDAARGDVRAASARALARLARPRIGVPSGLAIDDEEAAALFAAAVGRLERLGACLVDVDIAPFAAAGDLLYGGPWVAERFAAVGAFIRSHPDARLDPAVRDVILAAAELSAADAYRGMYRLADLVAESRSAWSAIDALALPTVTDAPTHADVAAAPHEVNTRLGRYTRFVNLMDLCAVSVPAGVRAGGVPFGLQLIAPALEDAFLCDLAERFEAGPPLGGRVRLAVVGAHLRGEPLNHQLADRGARLVASTRTAPAYRLFRLAGGGLPKPGLMRVGPGGAEVEVEVWELDVAAFGSFVAEVPPPLAIGTVELRDGTGVKGFLCEPSALHDALEITAYGGWRGYLRDLPAS